MRYESIKVKKSLRLRAQMFDLKSVNVVAQVLTSKLLQWYLPDSVAVSVSNVLVWVVNDNWPGSVLE